MNDITNLSAYRDCLRDLKQQIKKEQIKAAFSVNSQMIALYWDMGRQITEKQKKAKWGSGFIEYYAKALLIREKVLGKDHPNTSTTYNNMADVYEKKGDHSAAQELRNKSLTIHKNPN